MKPLLISAMLTLLTLLTLPLIGAEYYDRGKLRTLTPETVPTIQTNSVSMKTRSSGSTRWYRNEQGQRVGVNSAILIKWNDITQAETVLSDFLLTGATKISETIWLVPLAQTADIFEITKKLYEHEAVEFAQPDMIKERKLR